MVRNQRGLTLIELLATLSILSFIGVIIWNVFFQGYHYSQKAINKNMLQQEANIVITRLTKIHQISKEYELITAGCQITVNYTNQDNTQQSEIFEHSKFCYSTNFSGLVDPNADDIKLKIFISDKNDPNNRAEVDTILYRLKD